MVQSSDPVGQAPPPAVPMKRGSYVKGIALSLLFQGIAGFGGALVYAWSDCQPRHFRAGEGCDPDGWFPPGDLLRVHALDSRSAAVPEMEMTGRDSIGARAGDYVDSRRLSEFFCLASALIGFVWDAWDQIKH